MLRKQWGWGQGGESLQNYPQCPLQGIILSNRCEGFLNNKDDDS